MARKIIEGMTVKAKTAGYVNVEPEHQHEHDVHRHDATAASSSAIPCYSASR